MLLHTLVPGTRLGEPNWCQAWQAPIRSALSCVAADEEASRKDTQDELSLLPAHKRRKLQQLNRSRKQVELVSQLATFIWPQSANPCICCSCFLHSQVSWLHLCTDALAHGHLLPLTLCCKSKEHTGKNAELMLKIDLDNEDNDGDENGSQGLYIVGKPSTKKAAESDSDLDLEYKPLVKRYVGRHL